MKSGQWSYSSLAEYRKCPRMWKHNHVDRLPTKATRWMRRGNDLHKHCEHYISRQIDHIIPPLLPIAETLTDLREKGAICERYFRLNKDWQVCEKDSQWVKGFLDASYVENETLHVTDFKSGKIKDYHADQLQLYAIVGARAEPVSAVKVQAVYIDHGKTLHQREYGRDELEEHRQRWHAEAASMLADETYTPTPSAQSCKRCSYKSKDGGPCELWRDAA
jgi:CRISPR/Cas system-associated exonuclease Cas4 (RecB family)